MAATLLLLLQVVHHILITFVDASGTDGFPPPLEFATSLQRTLEPYNYTFSRSNPITVERAWDFLYLNWITLRALKKQKFRIAFLAEKLLKQLDVYYQMTLDPANADVPENILFSLNIEQPIDDRIRKILQAMYQQLRTLGGPYHFRYHAHFDFAYGRFRLYIALLFRYFNLRGGHQAGRMSIKDTRLIWKLDQSVISLGHKLKAYSDRYQLTSDTPVETDVAISSSFNEDITKVRYWAKMLIKPELEAISEDGEPEMDDDDEATLSELSDDSSSYNLPPQNAEEDEEEDLMTQPPRQEVELESVAPVDDTDMADATQVPDYLNEQQQSAGSLSLSTSWDDSNLNVVNNLEALKPWTMESRLEDTSSASSKDRQSSKKAKETEQPPETVTPEAATEVWVKEPLVVTPEAASQFPTVKASPSSIIELPLPTPPAKSNPSNPAVSQPKQAHNRLVQLLKNPYFLTVGTVVAVGAVWHLMDNRKNGGITFKNSKYHAPLDDHVGGSGIGWIVFITILVLLSGGVAVWLYYRKQNKTQGGSGKEKDPLATDSPSPTTSV